MHELSGSLGSALTLQKQVDQVRAVIDGGFDLKNPEQAREFDTLDHALCEAEIMLQGLDAFDRRQSVLARRGAPPEGSRPVQSGGTVHHVARSEEHTSELQSLMRIPYAVFCLK